jgi:hypothetical protein
MDKPKFNFMDAFIIVMILLVAAAGFLFLNKPDSTGNAPQSVTAQYTVELTRCEKVVADAFAEALANSESVMVGEKERFAAQLVDVQVNPAKRLVTDSKTGTTVLAEDPMYFDILLTLESQVTESNSAIMAGNTPLKVGEDEVVRSKKSAGLGYITSLKIK